MTDQRNLSRRVARRHVFAVEFYIVVFALAGSCRSATTEMSVEDQSAIVYSQPSIVFKSIELIDGTGRSAQYDMSVLIQAGRITAVGPTSTLQPPVGATIIDGHGKTLIPGFVMVHEHMFYPSTKAGQYEEYLYSFSRLYLAGGATTIRTAGSLAPYGDINLAAAIAKHLQPGPDIDATGPYLEGATLTSYKMASLKSADDAKQTVDFWSEHGATSFKAYNYITRTELKAAIDEVHSRDLKITGHLCSITYGEAADMGIDNLEHSFAVATDFVPDKQPDVCPSGQETLASLMALDPNGELVGMLMRKLIARRVALTSTLTVFETMAAGRPRAAEAALNLLTPQLRQSYEMTWATVQNSPRGRLYSAFFPRLMRMEKRYVELGGTLLAGTDPTGYGGVVPGWAQRREVQLLTEEGFDFPQALKISTLNGAVFLRRDKNIGSITVGKRADLILVDGDPIKDRTALDRMPLVFKAGVGYNTATFFESLSGKIGLY